MARMIGKNMTIQLSTGDGRIYELDNAHVKNIEIRSAIDSYPSEFEISFTAPYIMQRSTDVEVNISGFGDPFKFLLDEEKAAEHGLVHGVNFCKGCGSDWVGDGRIEDGKGNCGYCGAPRHWDRAEGDIVLGLDK